MELLNKKYWSGAALFVGFLFPLVCLVSCHGGGRVGGEQSCVEESEPAYWRVAMECSASASPENYPEVSRLSFEQGEEWWGLIRDKKAIMLPGGTRLESVEPASDDLSKIKVNGRVWYVSSGFLEFVEP